MSAIATTTTTPLSFEQLYTTYYARILSYAIRLLGQREDAEDVTQETFVKVARALPTLKAEQVSAWIYRIATNTARDLLRRRRSQQAHRCAQDFETVTLASDDDLHEHAAFREQFSQSWQRLPSKYQAVLRSLMEGYTISELASMRSVSHVVMKNRVYRARRALRQAYQEARA